MRPYHIIGGVMLIYLFVLPYIIASPSHVYFSVGQLWLAIFMGAVIIAIDGIINPLPLWAWFSITVIGIGAIFAYRLQLGVDDRGWLQEMIPNQSTALLVSTHRAQSKDPMIQRLAEKILLTQRQEIGEMEVMLTQKRSL